MIEDGERRYDVTPIPCADEVLRGATQGGVAPPPGFLADAVNDATTEVLVDEFTDLTNATQTLRAARRELEAARADVERAQVRKSEAANAVQAAETAVRRRSQEGSLTC